MIYADCFSESLLDFPAKNPDSRTIAAVFSSAFASGEHGFHVVNEPADFDIVVFSRNTSFGTVYHCGIFICGMVLHSVRGLGVIYKPLSEAARGFRGYEFWRK